MVAKWIAATAALWALSGTAAAVGNIADVMIYDRAEGRTLPVYRHAGRYYVVGLPGGEYQIRVRNRTGAEILAVVSVDGVNAVTGETAGWGQTGYVLSPYQSYDIKGWRKSLQRVASFFFTEHANSYAARTGRPENVGVIGIAVFRKKTDAAARLDQRPWPAEPAAGTARENPLPWSSDSPNGAASARSLDSGGKGTTPDSTSRGAPAPQLAEKSTPLGTGHGRSETSRVTYTSFERATPTPEEVVVIHYDTYGNLVAQGVIKPPRVATPTPFPGQFVPDPR